MMMNDMAGAYHAAPMSAMRVACVGVDAVSSRGLGALAFSGAESAAGGRWRQAGGSGQVVPFQRDKDDSTTRQEMGDGNLPRRLCASNRHVNTDVSRHGCRDGYFRQKSHGSAMAQPSTRLSLDYRRDQAMPSHASQP